MLFSTHTDCVYFLSPPLPSSQTHQERCPLSTPRLSVSTATGWLRLTRKIQLQSWNSTSNCPSTSWSGFHHTMRVLFRSVCININNTASGWFIWSITCQNIAQTWLSTLSLSLTSFTASGVRCVDYSNLDSNPCLCWLALINFQLRFTLHMYLPFYCMYCSIWPSQ